MRQKISGVYWIKSPSGRAYIGSSVNMLHRRSQHFYQMRKGTHPCSGLQRAWNKYGDQLEFQIVHICEPDRRILVEQIWIDNHMMVCGRMYNASGIAGRPEHTPEVRAKIAKAATGRKVSAETRALLSEVWRGRKHTPETIAKMRENGKNQPKERIEKMQEGARNRVFTEEQRKALSERVKGKKASEETRAKMRASHAARDLSNLYTDEMRKKLSDCKLKAGKRKGNFSSQFKGVSKEGDLWKASIMLAGKIYRLGRHKTEIAAALAYNAKAIELLGPDAVVNKIE